MQMHKIDLFYSWVLQDVSEVGIFNHNPTQRTQKSRALFALSVGSATQNLAPNETEKETKTEFPYPKQVPQDL